MVLKEIYKKIQESVVHIAREKWAISDFRFPKFKGDEKIVENSLPFESSSHKKYN